MPLKTKQVKERTVFSTYLLNLSAMDRMLYKVNFNAEKIWLEFLIFVFLD